MDAHAGPCIAVTHRAGTVHLQIMQKRLCMDCSTMSVCVCVCVCHTQVPRLTPEHHAAIKLFEEIAASDEVAMHYILQPGDIQLLNNHTCLHHRTAFEDFEVSLHLCVCVAVCGWWGSGYAWNAESSVTVCARVCEHKRAKAS